jgi:transcriptional regulator with XRE-family HTH domain
MDTRRLGRRLAALRELKGWSVDEAGDKAGLHPNTVRNVEKGAGSMQLRTLDALAYVYGTTVADLCREQKRVRHA